MLPAHGRHPQHTAVLEGGYRVGLAPALFGFFKGWQSLVAERLDPQIPPPSLPPLPLLKGREQ